MNEDTGGDAGVVHIFSEVGGPGSAMVERMMLGASVFDTGVFVGMKPKAERK